MSIDKQLEKRTEQRVETEDGAFVFFGQQPAISGKMVDVSPRGLGFTYLADERRTPETLELRMLSFAHNMLAQGLEGEVVYDVSAQEGTATPGERRCGVRFEHLSEDQQQMLRDFLLCYTGYNN